MKTKANSSPGAEIVCVLIAVAIFVWAKTNPNTALDILESIYPGDTIKQGWLLVMVPTGIWVIGMYFSSAKLTLWRWLVMAACAWAMIMCFAPPDFNPLGFKRLEFN